MFSFPTTYSFFLYLFFPVIHDVTAVLLEPKFIDSLIVGSTQPNAQLLTEEHCKFMLKDIATCSLMRLDDISMDKLWNLMTMIYKWQLHQTKQQYHLMDITFRHLQAISCLHPDEKRSMLIDFSKNTLLDFWNSCSDEEQFSIYKTNKAWLELFNTKISLLIRLGFQDLDGTFFENVNASYYQDFKDCIGDNIYIKSAEIVELKKHQINENAINTNTNTSSSAKCVNQLAEMLNISQASSIKMDNVALEDFKPINVQEFQKNFEQNLQQCNILFQDFDVSTESSSQSRHNMTTVSSQEGEEFVHLQPLYNKQINVTATASTIPTSTDNTPSRGEQLTTTAFTKNLIDL